jgi:hypothetical protein
VHQVYAPKARVLGIRIHIPLTANAGQRMATRRALANGETVATSLELVGLGKDFATTKTASRANATN